MYTTFLRVLLSCLCLTLVATVSCQGQKENNIWNFGLGLRLDFNVTPPVASANAGLHFGEASATASDSTGQLLFYSNGTEVRDRNGNTMPNGSGILGNVSGSSSQGVAIAPHPRNRNLYYLFVLDEWDMDPSFVGYLRYSVIDMSLNGGLGDVTGQKNIILEDSMSEKMTTLKGDGCYSWVLTHKYGSNRWTAFRIDDSGLHTSPVVSDIGAGSNGFDNMISYIRGSTDHHSVAGVMIDGLYTGPTTIELYDFNNTTGVLSNPRVIDSIPDTLQCYALCFSPDNSKLYLGTILTNVSYTSWMFQYDLSLLPNLAAVRASRYKVAEIGKWLGDIKIAPDGKIYFSPVGDTVLGIIHAPNLPGAACNYVYHGLTLPYYTRYSLGTDVMNTVYYSEDPVPLNDTIVCFDTILLVWAPQGYTDFLWNDGSENAFNLLRDSNIKWVRSVSGCAVRTDSFRAEFINFSLELGNDTLICPGDEITLTAAVDGGTHRWQDESTAAHYQVRSPGTYSVHVSVKGCSLADTLTVSPKSIGIWLGPDRIYCDSASYLLIPDSSSGGNYLWQDGSRDSVLRVTETGVYSVVLSDAGCTATDEVMITLLDCDCRAWVPDVFSPNGDGRNDAIAPVVDCDLHNTYTFRIFDRWGNLVFLSFKPGERWDGNFRGRPAEQGVYFYSLLLEGKYRQEQKLMGDITLIR